MDEAGNVKWEYKVWSYKFRIVYFSPTSADWKLWQKLILIVIKY